MTKKESGSINFTIKRSYKNKLDKAVLDLSYEVEERVPLTKVVYKLIDNYLDKAIADVKKEY